MAMKCVEGLRYASKPPAEPAHGGFRWQYHYTTPFENDSPSTGLVLRAVSDTGEELIRHYINQNSEGTATRFYSIIKNLHGDHLLRLSFESGPDGHESLVGIIEDTAEKTLSTVSYIKTSFISARAPIQLAKFNEERRLNREEHGPFELEQLPWLDLNGSIRDQSGSYSPPRPDPTRRAESPVADPSVEDTSEPASKMVGDDEAMFRFDVSARQGGGRRGRVYALLRARADQLPRWREGMPLPLSADKAAEMALAYERDRLRPPETEVALNTVELHSFSHDPYRDVWYSLVKVRIEGGHSFIPEFHYSISSSRGCPSGLPWRASRARLLPRDAA